VAAQSLPCDIVSDRRRGTSSASGPIDSLLELRAQRMLVPGQWAWTLPASSATAEADSQSFDVAFPYGVGYKERCPLQRTSGILGVLLNL